MATLVALTGRSRTFGGITHLNLTNISNKFPVATITSLSENVIPTIVWMVATVEKTGKLLFCGNVAITIRISNGKKIKVGPKVNGLWTYRLEKRNASGYSIDGGNGGAKGQGLVLYRSDDSNKNQQWTFKRES